MPMFHVGQTTQNQETDYANAPYCDCRSSLRTSSRRNQREKARLRRKRESPSDLRCSTLNVSHDLKHGSREDSCD